MNRNSMQTYFIVPAVVCAVLTMLALFSGCGKRDSRGSGADKLMNSGRKTADKSKKVAKTPAAELPEGQRWKSRVYRLRVRSAPTLKSEIVGHLHKGQLVVELERKKESKTVSGRKGHWLKIQSDQNVVGWTFSGFLAKAE